MILVSNKYKKRLNSIKNRVVKQFAKGNSSKWRNRDFEDLSFEINKASKVLISAATLKRIFGKNKTSDSYYPQETTLEAMEKFASLGVKKRNYYFPPIQKKHLWLLLIPIFLLAIILFKSKDSTTGKITNAKIKVNKIDGNSPATVFFSYNLPEIKDSIFISFGDGYPLHLLSFNENAISHVYNYPGVFNVSLQTGEQIISDTVKVLVPTNGWQALASYYQQNYRQRFYPIPLELARGLEGFHPSCSNLSSIGMDTTQIVVLRLDNFKASHKNGDSFTLKTRIKNANYWPAIRCYSGFIKVIGENGSIIFKLTNKGCSGYGQFSLSEKSVHGSTADLSSLSLNMKSWNNVEINNVLKNVSLKINEQTVFQESYNKSIGNIVGVSLQFHGSGYVDYFELLDKNNEAIFYKHF